MLGEDMTYEIMCELKTLEEIAISFNEGALWSLTDEELEQLDQVTESLRNAVTLEKIARTIQTTDIPKRKVGKWIKTKHGILQTDVLCCSICHKYSPLKTPFCALCGSEMKGEQERESEKI